MVQQCCLTNPLECCLFFSANSLARAISRLGEEEFAPLGMTPSYAFLLSLVINQPGISQKDLAKILNMAPSTVSRFVDSLARRGLLHKEGQGRHTFIHPTAEGQALKPRIIEAWGRLQQRYNKILGQENGALLTRLTAEASRKLQQG
jgi:MarR family transcriptional regulator, organic hydroperoxide resistance regulator